MGDDKVELIITADPTQAQKGFREIDNSIDELSNTAKQASEQLRSSLDIQGADRARSALDSVRQGADSVGEGARGMGDALTLSLATFAGNLAAGAVLKGIELLKDGLASIPDAIGRGSAIDDIASSFEKLTEKAGVASDALINQLSGALGNTIPKVDLMRQANELLVGGLDPSQFELVAKAARSFGEATGTDATTGMAALSDSLLRGSDRALKTLGIVVDNNKALEDFAKKIGISVEALNEEGKVQALREANLRALADAQSRLGDVTDDAADKLDQMKTALRNQVDEGLRALANNKDLNAALDSLVKTVASADFSKLINGLSSIAVLAVEAAEAIVKIGGAVAEAFDTRADAVKTFTAEVAKVDDLAASMEKLAKKMNEIKFNDGTQAQLDALKPKFKDIETQLKAINDQAAKDKLADMFIQLNKAANEYYPTLKKVAATTGEASGEAAKYTDGLKKHEAELKKAEKAEKELADRKKELQALSEKVRDALQKEAEQIQKTYEASQAYSSTLEALKNGSIETDQAQVQLTAAYNQAEQAVRAQREAEDAFNAVLADTNLTIEERNRLLGETSLALAQAKQATDALSSSQAKGAKVSGSYGDSIASAFGMGGAGAGGAAGYAGMVNAILGVFEGTGDVIQSDQTPEEKAKQLYHTYRRRIGRIFSLGISEAIISIIGEKTLAEWQDALEEFDPTVMLLTHWFSSNKSTEIRKAVDRFFSDAFEAEPILAVVNGQLQKIEDLAFSGPTLAGGNIDYATNIADAFNALPAAAQQAFQGVGLAFEEILGVAGELDFALANIFVNNIGGSLNNLQLLVESSGLSFEQLHDKIVEAFLDGELSAAQAQDALIGIQRTAEKGIPDGLGMTIQAFDNLKAAGPKGGRAVVDALQDIGYEAQELGIKTFPDLMANLQASGKYSADEIQQVFTALEHAGIDSIDELTNATQEQLIAALAELENFKFPFSEQTAEINDYIQAVNSIPETKSTRLQVKVDISNEDREVINAVSGRSNLGVGQPIQ